MTAPAPTPGAQIAEIVNHWAAMRTHRSSRHKDLCWQYHPECAMRRIVELTADHFDLSIAELEALQPEPCPSEGEPVVHVDVDQVSVERQVRGPLNDHGADQPGLMELGEEPVTIGHVQLGDATGPLLVEPLDALTILGRPDRPDPRDRQRPTDLTMPHPSDRTGDPRQDGLR